MKPLIYGILLVLLLISALFFQQVWQNNRDITPLGSDNIRPHFDKSVTWLNNNYSQLEDTNNPILWWFIKQAALTSGDKTLTRLYHQYKKNHLDNQLPNLSTPMFDELYHPRVPDINQLSNLKDYQIFFFYALSCDADLASEPLIQKQLAPEFCSSHYIHPRCITHQLMGLRFMQRYQCGYDETVNATIAELQNLVDAELSWDFRVGDAYIQRVLMLVETGAYDRVKPVWISNILDAQNDDGSWDDLHPVLSLGNGNVLALTSMLPKIKKPKADFHASAQAIWLLSLLLDESKNQAPSINQ